MPTPKVSVLTCSHDRPTLLRVAIESLHAQTDQDWEHLIYDDASTDKKVDETLRWATEDPRVRVWRRTNNLDRPSVLWNFMLDRARGHYLTILDDDNEKLPQFIEIMAEALDANLALGFVTCGWIVIHLDGSWERDCHYNLETCESNLAKKSTCEGCSVMFRRDALDRAGYFSEALRTNEDWDWMRRAAATSNFVNLSQCLTKYRNHDANRMFRRKELGNDTDEVQVLLRNVAWRS